MSRSRMAFKTGEVVLIDHENSTVGYYGVKCCSTQVSAKKTKTYDP